MVKIHSLTDLKVVKREIAARAQQRLDEAAEAARLLRKNAANKNLFISAVGMVQALPDQRQAVLKKDKPKPIPVQRQRDEQAVLVEAISDEFDVSSLLDTDEHLSYARPGTGADVCVKLRKGHWKIQRELDLHGLRSDDARESLSHFIRVAKKQGLRCLRIIHGKGLGSPGKTPVLKGRVQSWLVQKKEVLAFVQARPVDGGAGALVVLLVPG